MARTKLEVIGGTESSLGSLEKLLPDAEAVAWEAIPATLIRLGYLGSRIAALASALAARVVGRSYERRAEEPDRLVSVKEAARLLGVSTDFVYEHQDDLPAVREGRRLLFSFQGLQRHLGDRRTRAASRR